MSILPATMLLYLVAISTIFRSHSTAVPQDGQSSPLTCNSCCQGQMGVAGVPGVPGVPGGNGPQGPAGPRGEIGQPGVATKGEKGDVGGPQGEPGRGGAPGKAGPSGQDGAPGRDGLVGSPGGKGKKGEIGVPRFSGFTVLKTSSQIDSGVVTFDTAITNAAGHYDINSNKFSCQIPGYYMFTFSIGFRESNGPWVNLMKNEETIINTYGYPAQGANYRNMATNTALLLLASGDQVWLSKKYSYQTRQIYADSTWKWTTFSGILLHET